MGQIVFNGQKPKYCNLQAIQTGGLHVNDDVALNEVWLVDTTEAAKSATGTGEYDAYIIGDGSHKAGQLELHYLGTAIDISKYSTTLEMQSAINQAITNANIPRNLSQLNEDTNHQTVSQTEKDLWSTGGSGSITNNVDHEDLTSVEVSQGVSVIKFNDKAYNASTYSGLGKKYLRKNIQTTVDIITDRIPNSELHPGEYINTNQGVGNVCPMTVGTYSSFCYYKGEVKSGDTWIVKGRGGGTPRLWALINKTDNTIIAAADINEESISDPITLNIEEDCILIVNSQNGYPDITYRTTAESSSEKNLLNTAMMTSANTRYVIQYDYDLGGQTLELPQNCVLVFEGGSIKNGMIMGNGASIIADANSKIFDLSLELSGTWHTADFYPEWFGAKGDMVNDDTTYIQKVFNLHMTEGGSSQIGITCHLDNRYRVTDSLIINDDIHITGKSNVSLNKGSNTNGTILADFGEDWKKWVITTNNIDVETRELIPFNGSFNHNGIWKGDHLVAVRWPGGGIKIDGINIRTIGKAYGGIRIGGACDGSIDNVAIGGVYVGIHRISCWYSADSHLHINAYICGYACYGEDNGHSLRDAYINPIRISKDTEGVIWSKLIFTETTTLYDKDDNEIVLNEGDTITLYSQSMVYVNDSITPVRIKMGSEFSANWYDENNSTEGNPVYVPVTCYVEYNSAKPNEYEQWVLVPWWDYENKYIAPKWQFKKELLLASMPKSGWNTPSKYVFANKNIGFFQVYGNSVLSNVIMEVWNTGLYACGTSTTVDISPYREAVDGVYYVGDSNARINVIGAVNGALGNVDGHHRFHAIVQGTSRILLSSSSFSAIDIVPDAAHAAKVVYANPIVNAVALGGNIVRDRREDEYIVTVGNTNATEFNRTINSAMASSWESISIPENYTAIFDGVIISGNKYIRGKSTSTSILNINSSPAFYGENLVFRNLTVNINYPINGNTVSGVTSYYNLIHNKKITFIGCIVNVNGTSIVSYGNYNVDLSIIGSQNERTSLTLKDTASANSYISAYRRPNLNVNDTQNLRLFIKQEYVTISVLDANGDAVTITEGNTTRNVTVYDRIYAVSNADAFSSRNSNLQLLNKLNCGITDNRPTLSPNIKGFEYFDCTLGQPVWWNGSAWVSWSAQSANYETKTEIVSYNTAPASITAQDNKYYRIDAAVDTLAITLPEITDTTTTHTIVFSFSTGTTPNVTFASASNSAISYFDGYEIEAGTTYELIAIFNGLKWIISYGVVA